MFIVQLVSWLLPISILVYLVMLIRLVIKLKRDQVEYWKLIGSPSISDPNGQVVILWKVIYGSELPDSVASVYKRELATVRVLFILNTVLFIAVTAMILGGVFER